MTITFAIGGSIKEFVARSDTLYQSNKRRTGFKSLFACCDILLAKENKRRARQRQESLPLVTPFAESFARARRLPLTVVLKAVKQYFRYARTVVPVVLQWCMPCIFRSYVRVRDLYASRSVLAYRRLPDDKREERRRKRLAARAEARRLRMGAEDALTGQSSGSHSEPDSSSERIVEGDDGTDESDSE